MKNLVILGFLVTLTACGVDGAPTAKAPDPEPTPGFSVSGDVRMGVVSGTNRR